MEGVELAGVFDRDGARATAIAQEFATRAFNRLEDLQGAVDAATVSVPTVSHEEVGCRLMEMGIDVLVEKPMASALAEADALLDAASRRGRILQVGHVERFNPAVLAVEPVVSRPLFFEVHRLGVFTPRSLDVDVIYDVMIHDLDILLALVKERVTEVKAVGIPVLTDKVDIAHARLEFADYARRDALRIGVKRPGPQPEFAFEKLAAPAVEPLRGELEAFVEAVRTRVAPKTDGTSGRAALELASAVMTSIREHAARVQPVAPSGVDKIKQ
jgi:predicted dehydrogenase